mmetsp:Transcript_66277/g.138422  ORF Transcript_66277/g.138422 Transcript_66277/m.138422 type:complete len:625 (+) Transcript_66277:55-1929(+)
MLDLSRNPRIGDDDQLPSTFIGLRMWVEQEVRAHVKLAVRELQAAAQPSPASPMPDAFSPGLEGSRIDDSVLEDLAELTSRQRKQGLEIQELKEAVIASTPPRPTATPTRIRSRTGASPVTERQEARLHSLSLNLADQTKRLRQVSEDIQALQEDMQDLKETMQEREATKKSTASSSGHQKDTHEHVASLVSKHLEEVGLAQRLQELKQSQDKTEAQDQTARTMVEDLRSETQKGLQRLNNQLRILRRTLVNQQQAHFPAPSPPPPGSLSHGSPLKEQGYFDDQAGQNEIYLSAHHAPGAATFGVEAYGIAGSPFHRSFYTPEAEQSSGEALQQGKQHADWSETLAAAQAHLTGGRGQPQLQTPGNPAPDLDIPLMPEAWPTEPVQTVDAVMDSDFLAQTEDFEEEDFGEAELAPQFGAGRQQQQQQQHHFQSLALGEMGGSPKGRAGAALAGRTFLEGSQAAAIDNGWQVEDWAEGEGRTGKSPKGALANAALAGRTLVEGLRRQATEENDNNNNNNNTNNASKPPAGRRRRGRRLPADDSSSDTTDPEGVVGSSSKRATASSAAAGTERRLRRASAVAAAAAAAAGAGGGSLGRRIRSLAAGMDSPIFGQRSALFSAELVEH